MNRLLGLILSFVILSACVHEPNSRSSDRWTILSASGKHGVETFWIDQIGQRRSHLEMSRSGRTTDLKMAWRVDDNETPIAISITGDSIRGGVEEYFSAKDGRATWISGVDQGNVVWTEDTVYLPFNSPITGTFAVVRSLLNDPDGRKHALPNGTLTVEKLASHRVQNGEKSLMVTAVALGGVAFERELFWIDQDGALFASLGWLTWIREGWEAAHSDLLIAEQEIRRQWAKAIAQRLLTDSDSPILIKNVTVYNSNTNDFDPNQSVLIRNDIIASVGEADAYEEHVEAIVIDGSGKTLIPGLWDMHYHFSGDVDGLLALSSGVTSVRDMGNDPDKILGLRARTESGELVGPNIYPVFAMDGDGPYSAQGFLKITSIAEGYALINRAKDERFHGIKLFGSINPDWVESLTTHAHAQGLKVFGHVPSGMRPSQAIASGYDGIVHMNYVLLEAMPQEVIDSSGGLSRFFGLAEFDDLVNFEEDPMKSLITEIVKNDIVIDPTMTIYESSYTVEKGAIAPAYAPYIGVMPPQIERRFKRGGFVPPADSGLTREDMIDSFKTAQRILAALVDRGAKIVPGTDGYSFDLIRELELYVIAGMSIGEALETATDGAARILEVEDTVGSIKAGQTADLVLIDGELEADISRLREVELVFVSGSMIKVEDLQNEIGIALER